MKKLSLDQTINQLRNLTDWAEDERKLEDINDIEIDTLRNAIEYLYRLQGLLK